MNLKNVVIISVVIVVIVLMFLILSCVRKPPMEDSGLTPEEIKEYISQE